MPEHILPIKKLSQAVANAAVAAYQDWGRGDKDHADQLSVDALRRELNKIRDFHGKIIIGEGEKDEAPQLYNGELVGAARQNAQISQKYDIAVDPLECTTYLANGMGNSLSVLAVAKAGAMFDVGPSFYMDKIVYGKEVFGKIDPYSPISTQLKLLAKAKGKDLRDIKIYMLNKERHKAIRAEVLNLGCSVAWYDAGDVSGALLAMQGGNEYDGLLGIGGTPEGVLCAAAANALGCEYFGRFNPLSEAEQVNISKFGLNTQKFYTANQLVADKQACFFAAGITKGLIHGNGIVKTAQFWRVPMLIINQDGIKFSHNTIKHHAVC